MDPEKQIHQHQLPSTSIDSLNFHEMTTKKNSNKKQIFLCEMIFVCLKKLNHLTRILFIYFITEQAAIGASKLISIN